jgi:predicted nucleic acid-binding protein
MIIIDTNVLSELMYPEPKPSVIKWVDENDRKDLGITSITVSEILYGIGVLPSGRRKQRLFEIAKVIFEKDFADRIFPFDKMAAVEYADIVIQRDKRGNPISMPDAQIAAICRVSGFTLATRNIKDFENIGIILINPWEV